MRADQDVMIMKDKIVRMFRSTFRCRYHFENLNRPENCCIHHTPSQNEKRSMSIMKTKSTEVRRKQIFYRSK